MEELPLSNRAINVMRKLLHCHDNEEGRLEGITVAEFSERYSAFDLLNTIGCGVEITKQIRAAMKMGGFHLKRINPGQRDKRPWVTYFRKV